MALSISVSLQKYQEAEIQRIEVFTRMREERYAYQHFADLVNRMIQIHADIESRGLQGAELEKEKAKLAALIPEARKLGKETETTIVVMNKQFELAMHFKFMRNLWLGICFVGATIGAIATLYGFRQWFLQPKNER